MDVEVKEGLKTKDDTLGEKEKRFEDWSLKVSNFELYMRVTLRFDSINGIVLFVFQRNVLSFQKHLKTGWSWRLS